MAKAPNPPIGTVPSPDKTYESTRMGNPRYSFRLLFSRWTGSVYKLVWKDLLAWLFIYYLLAIWYRLGMNPEQKKKFEFICRFCDKYNDLIPLTFVLGFYVNLVLQRWWTMWDMLPWPDNAAFYFSCAFPGQDEQSRMLRRTLVRYLNLASVHGKCLLSSRVRKRFPTMDHFVDAGLMTENERKIMEGLMEKGQKLYYVPLLWASLLVTKARNDKRINDFDWQQCLTLIVDFRSRISRSLHIELVNIPLVYSQVVALSVYIFSLSCLLGRQFINNEKYAVDMYIPIFTALQLVFYWGWLKVAESMIDPYGDDDADFNLNYYIDKNVRISYIIVDAVMGAEFPGPVKDPYWEQQVPEELPHTEESKEMEAKHPHPDLIGTQADVLPNAETLVKQLESTLSSSRRPSTKLRRRHSSVKGLMHRLHPMTNMAPLGSSTSACSGIQLYGIAEEGGTDGDGNGVTNGGYRGRGVATRVLSVSMNQGSAGLHAPPNSTIGAMRNSPPLLIVTRETSTRSLAPENGVPLAMDGDGSSHLDKENSAIGIGMEPGMLDRINDVESIPIAEYDLMQMAGEREKR